MNAELLLGSALTRLAAFGARRGRTGRLLILTYHRVLAERDPLLPDEIDAATFAWHLQLFARAFTVLPLSEALDRLARGSLPAAALCISFDDGYANNRHVALPLLELHAMPATFFVSTGFLDGGLMWNDAVIEAVRRARVPLLDLRSIGLGEIGLGDDAARRRAVEAILTAIKHRAPQRRADDVALIAEACAAELPRNLMMRSEEVCELRRAGMEIGAHTITHPILKSVPAQEAEREIRAGREFLEALLREPVSLFAYPNGRPMRDYDASHVAMVRRLGFRAAVSTAEGCAVAGSDVFQLPRTGAWGRSPLRLALQLSRTWAASPPAVA